MIKPPQTAYSLASGGVATAFPQAHPRHLGTVAHSAEAHPQAMPCANPDRMPESHGLRGTREAAHSLSTLCSTGIGDEHLPLALPMCGVVPGSHAEGMRTPAPGTRQEPAHRPFRHRRDSAQRCPSIEPNPSNGAASGAWHRSCYGACPSPASPCTQQQRLEEPRWKAPAP